MREFKVTAGYASARSPGSPDVLMHLPDPQAHLDHWAAVGTWKGKERKGKERDRACWTPFGSGVWLIRKDGVQA